MPHVLVLPAHAALFHGVADGDARVGIGEAERAARVERPPARVLLGAGRRRDVVGAARVVLRSEPPVR